MNRVVFTKLLLFLLFNFFLFSRILVNQTFAQGQSSTDTLQIEANPAWEGDYFVQDVQKDKTLVYISTKFNRGNLTLLFAPNGDKNLVAGSASGGAFYPHFILWPQNNQWSEGDYNPQNPFKIINQNSQTKGFVEWEGLGSWSDESLGFEESLNQKIALTEHNLNDLLVIKTRTTFKAKKDISNFRALYIELGWTANDYQFVSAPLPNGRIEQAVSGNPGVHHFYQQNDYSYKIKSGDYMVAYNSSILDGSMALVFDDLKITGNSQGSLPHAPYETFFISWDTSKVEDNTDTMELHVEDPKYGDNDPPPNIIKAGTVVTLDYFVVIKDGVSGSDWVPPLSFLRDLFVKQDLHQEYAMGNYLANRIWWERDDPLGPHWDISKIKQNLELQYKAFHETGARFARDEFSWFNIEKSPGNFDWVANDLALSYYDTTDEIQGLLTGTAEWASDYPPGEEVNARKYPARDDSAWENYIRQVVTRYKNRVKYWEIWSEGDCVDAQGVPVNFIPRPWKSREEEYFRLLRIAYNTIKSIDPTLQVLINGFGSWNITGSFDNPGVGDGMVRFILTYGGQPYFDIFNIHTYTGHDPAIEVQNSRTLLSHWPSTANKEIWVTETNPVVYLRQHFGGQSGVTIARGAEYMRWWYQRHFDAGASKVFWFTIDNWPCEPGIYCFEIPGLVTYMGANKQVTWYEFRDLVYGMPSLRVGWQTKFTISKIPEFCPVYSYKGNQGFWKTGVINYNQSLSVIPSRLYFLCK